MFNDSIKIKWKGKEYTCPVNMGTARQLSNSGINILNSAIELGKGGIPDPVLVADICAGLLLAAGCKTSADEVFLELMGDPQGNANLAVFAKLAIVAFFPERQEGAERTTATDGKKS